MKKLQDPQYRIPQWALTDAIEGLQELARRLEADAIELSKIGTTESRMLAQERLEQAWEYRKAHEFYLHL